MMTRKDYVDTSKILCEFAVRTKILPKDFDWLVEQFAAMFLAENPAFMKHRFIAGCNGY